MIVISHVRLKSIIEINKNDVLNIYKIFLRQEHESILPKMSSPPQHILNILLLSFAELIPVSSPLNVIGRTAESALLS